MALRLRTGLSFEQADGADGFPLVVIKDPLTRRSFGLPEEAQEVIDRLQTPTSRDELVAALADEFDAEEVDALLDQLAKKHLLADDRTEAELRQDITAQHRAECFARFQNVLAFAKEKIPFYRERYADIDGHLGDTDDALSVPFLRKTDIRAHYPDGFVPDGESLEQLISSGAASISASSGTSAGDRLQMISTSEARSKQMLAGARLNLELEAAASEQQSVLTSTHCADPNFCVREEPKMEKRIQVGVRHLLIPPMDPSAPTKDELDQIVDELTRHRPRWLDCNPTYLAAVSYALFDADIKPPSVEVITCGFEFLSQIHRKILGTVWGCNVYNRYTASEVGNFQALECEHGSLHVNDLYFYPELVRDGRYVAPGALGRLVQTTVKERIPLIRYDTGDLFFAAKDEHCGCGGVSRRFGAIAGRARDLMTDPAGRLVTTYEVDQAVSKVDGIRFYQVSQTADTDYEARIVVGRASDVDAARDATKNVLSDLLGARANIRVNRAKRIYPETSDKFRLTRSHVENIADQITV